MHSYLEACVIYSGTCNINVTICEWTLVVNGWKAVSVMDSDQIMRFLTLIGHNYIMI